MKPIVNSLTPSAIRAEHSEIENLRLENKNLVAQLDSSRSELATAQKTVEELKAKKMSEVTPALIMDYASVQAERDSLRSKLQTAMEERDQWKCSAQLYHEELRRLADGRKVETNLAHPVEEKIATANSRLEEAHSVSKSLFKDHLALQAHVKACHAALQRISDIGCVDVRAAHMAAECLSSQPDRGLVEEVVKALEFARDEIGYAGNKVICDALTRLTRLSKPNDP